MPGDPIPVFLKKILAEHLTGELLVQVDDIEKKLYFMDGTLVFARSSQLDERIGVVLYMIGKISQELYDSLSGLVHSIGQEVGEILEQNHFVSQEDLDQARTYLVRRIALSLFALEKGSWDFEYRIPRIPENEKTFIPLTGIIVEGSRKITNIAYFKNKVYFLSPRTTAIPAPFPTLLAAEEMIFFNNLEECRDLSHREIISRFNLLPDVYWEKLALFMMLGAVEFVEHPDREDLTANIEDLLKLNERLAGGDVHPYEILGISETAPLKDIEHAFRTRSHRFHPDRYGSAAAPEIKGIARTVSAAIEGAYQELLHKKQEEAALVPEQKEAASGEEPRLKANEMFERAERLWQWGDFQPAISLLREVVRLDPTRGKYFYRLGVYQGEFDYFYGDAERNLKKAIELEPANPDPVYTLGLLYRKENKLNLSEKCFQRVLEMDRSHLEASRAIAGLKQKRRR